jgi:hypothetical protein
MRVVSSGANAVSRVPARSRRGARHVVPAAANAASRDAPVEGELAVFGRAEDVMAMEEPLGHDVF